MEDPQELYQLYGHYEFTAKIASNALLLRTVGPNNLKFPDGQLITFQMPTKKVGGMLWGDRTIIHDDTFCIEDKNNGWKCVIFINAKKYAMIQGKLYNYNPELQL